MKNIYLVGFMGSGKSTVGKILAEKLKGSLKENR
jgi:shikimate kinase